MCRRRRHRRLPCRRPPADPSYAFVGTVSQAIDLVGQYQSAGIELLIIGARNDEETREFFVSDVMPHFA